MPKGNHFPPGHHKSKEQLRTTQVCSRWKPQHHISLRGCKERGCKDQSETTVRYSFSLQISKKTHQQENLKGCIKKKSFLSVSWTCATNIDRITPPLNWEMNWWLCPWSLYSTVNNNASVTKTICRQWVSVFLRNLKLRSKTAQTTKDRWPYITVFYFNAYTAHDLSSAKWIGQLTSLSQ